MRNAVVAGCNVAGVSCNVAGVSCKVGRVSFNVGRVSFNVARVSCNVTGNTCNITRVRRPRLPNTQSPLEAGNTTRNLNKRSTAFNKFRIYVM